MARRRCPPPGPSASCGALRADNPEVTAVEARFVHLVATRGPLAADRARPPGPAAGLRHRGRHWSRRPRPPRTPPRCWWSPASAPSAPGRRRPPTSPASAAWRPSPASSAACATRSPGRCDDPRALARALADRMTETVLASAEEAAGPVRRRPAAPAADHRPGLRSRGGAGPGRPPAGAGAVARRDRLPGPGLRPPGPRSHRRRADDVRPGQQRALPAQDLQRRVRHRRRAASRSRCSR